MTTQETIQPPVVASAAAKPPAARWGVLFFLATMALVLYIDRVCIGQAEKSIREELVLTKEHMSLVFMAFTLAYCLFEVPAGHWGDRYGSRGVITRIVIMWSIFTALTGAAMWLWMLVGIRFLFGAGEAGAFPNVARVVTRWFPPAEQGFVRGTITTTSLVGGALSPQLAAWLIDHFGWRWTFAVFGLVGVIWAVAFWWWFRDDPREMTARSAAQPLLANEHDTKPPKDDSHFKIPWGLVLTSPNVWLLGTIMTVSATLFYMQFQWYPTYLKETSGLSEQESGACTSIVMVGGALGCILGGLFSDLVMRITDERRWTRRAIGGGCMLLAACSLAGVHYSDSFLTATLCNAGALFLLQLSIPSWWAVVAEISGRHGAAMFGLMNSLGGLGVMVMTYLVGKVVHARQEAKLPPIDCWQPVFDGVALALGVGVVCWLFVDAKRSIVAREMSAETPRVETN